MAYSRETKNELAEVWNIGQIFAPDKKKTGIMEVWLPTVIELLWMDSITMITDMARKIFGAEPQISATSMPDHATPPFWTERLTVLSYKMYSRQLAEISWKGE